MIWALLLLFILMGMLLCCLDLAFLHQDPEMLYGTYLTSYDLQLKWAALEGTVSTVCALTDVPLPIARH
jgi:hypothetical protein